MGPMMLPLPSRWHRNPWLLAALIALWGMPLTGEDQKLGLADKIIELRSSEASRISLLRDLGNLSKTPDCSLNQLFWHDVDVTQGAHLTLGLYRIDRLLAGTNAHVKADVLSLLMSQDSIWLRVGPREDTGWIKVDKQGSIEPEERELLFRSCSGTLL